MADLENVDKINNQIQLRADGRTSAWCAGAWETSNFIASLISRIEELERRLDNQENYCQKQNETN
jgi:hypothetical protein